MMQIITQLVKALRLLLSRFGFTSSTSSHPGNEQPDLHQPGLSSSDGKEAYEAPSLQTVEVGSVQALQEFKSQYPIESVQITKEDATVGQADGEGVDAGTGETSVQKGERVQNQDASSECGPVSEGADSGEVDSVIETSNGLSQAEQLSQFGDAGMERDQVHPQSLLGGVEPPTGEPTSSDEINESVTEQELAGDTNDTQCSIRCDETCSDVSASPTVLDRNASDRSEDWSDSVGAGDAATECESVEMDVIQIDELHPHSDSPSLPDPITDTSIANACELHATGGDTSSTDSADLPNKDSCRQEDMLKDMNTASVGTETSDSEADRQAIEEKAHESMSKGTRVPSPRRPTPAEDAHEYAVAVKDISAVDHEYARWNNAIVEQILLEGRSSEESYLCVNPRILAKVFEESGSGLLTPEQAEQQFSTAVASVYRKRVLGHSARLRVLRRYGIAGLPDCAAFLAGSVLAAFRMQSDEELSGNAYYRRLADLLDCERQGVHPVGFDPVVFESLWVFLRNWLRDVHGRRLVMPRDDVGFRRFVALPLAHVPLRSLDIEKLPVFFSWAGYQPGGAVRRDRLLADLKQWQRSRGMLTPTGAEALSDDRSPAVLAQVSAELTSWDGSFSESANRRSALVEIQFDVLQRNPRFFYLPRRPPGFPGVFDGGERVFEASDEGWYDPAQIHPEDGTVLESGFEWRAYANGIHFTLRRPGVVVVALTPSSICSGFLSSRRLLRGVRCSVLCRDNVLRSVKEYLSEVAQSTLNPISHPLLPNGWSIFRDFTARVHIEAPPSLEALEVDQNVEVIIVGGLRIGRRWSWLAGAPPRILVSGIETRDSVKVNGIPVEVNPSGELLTGNILATPGEHLIEIGRVRRRIEIARPEVSVRSEAAPPEPVNRCSRRIALPRGSWTLIGSSPGQVSHFRGESFHGTITSCLFEPIWGVQVGAGPGAVVAVSTYPTPPRGEPQGLSGQTRKMVERWTSTIYEAHIRHPRFIGLNGVVPDTSIVDIWRQYTTLAKQIKRSLKGPR